MMRVREADTHDAARIAHIHVESWRVAYRGRMPDAFLAALDEERRAEFWRTRLAESRGQVLVSELSGEVVGFCELIPTRDGDADPRRIGEIVAIYIHPEHWRKGAGQALCRRALDSARSLGFSAVTLWVLETNAQARGFYEILGFRRDGARKKEKLTADFEIAEIRYRLELPVRGVSG